MTGAFMLTFMSGCYKDDATSNETTETTDPLTETVLGDKLENPYTVENMQKAYDELQEEGATMSTKSSVEITTTDYYVRFLPANDEELQILENDSLNLFPYPLDYEIEEEGDYYSDGDTTEGQWYYTSVPVDYNFPDIKYEILADLFLPESVEDENSLTTEVYSDFLEKLEDKALEITGNADDEGSDSVFTTKRSKVNPSGHVFVKDTELGDDVPVVGVKVRTRRWFKYGNDYTNSEGHYEVDQKYKRDVHYILLFKNSSGFKIREHILSLSKARYNDGEHSKNGHDFYIDQDNPAWRFCTVNNAVVKYRAYCNEFGIGLPPSNLRIVAEDKEGSSSAPMLKHVWGVFGFTSKSDVLSFLGKANGISLTATQLGILLKFVLPDIIVKAASSQGTAKVYETCFHELSHASHYNKVGNAFWIKYINYIITYGITNNPYGKGTGNNAGLCALSEAWAYNMGYRLTLEEYKTASNPNGDNSRVKSVAIEKFTPHTVGDKNYSHQQLVSSKNGPIIAQSGWIPAGIMNDLVDNNADVIRTGYTDNVSGYTYKKLFDALDKDVTSPQEFRDRLLKENNNLDQADVKSLFEAYYWN